MSSSSSDSLSPKKRNFRSSAWRKGSVGGNRRSSMEGGIHKSDVSVSSYSSLPSGTLIDHHRRSSTGNSSNPPINSSSASADNLFETKSSIKFNDEDELKNQIEENFHLTLDLKMRLANAMAQIDAEKHTNRLQAEQISHLCDDNDELKCYLDQAYERIAKLERGDGNDDEDENINRHTDANLHQESSSCARPNEGWLRRVASTISLANNSTSSSTNVCADPQAQRKHAVSPCTTVSTQQSTMTLMERSTRRLSMLSLASSLAEEELPVSASLAERKSSMYSERRSSMYASLSTFLEEDTECLTEGQHLKGGTADEWLEGGVVLADTVEQMTFAARNA